ncbi:hypothetical protein GCM10012275_62070 [Longimycelium tulufanense]|uniref:Uncharacterized protein n=1 Tax=Longimycelium tulufanense TaxID=907463 RepID=A0A8J3FXW1_9PSEU|nr:hypothetical protein GCM10012275_62070 [Longimycelium tulufanense]
MGSPADVKGLTGGSAGLPPTPRVRGGVAWPQTSIQSAAAVEQFRRRAVLVVVDGARQPVFYAGHRLRTMSRAALLRRLCPVGVSGDPGWPHQFAGRRPCPIAVPRPVWRVVGPVG